MPKSDKRKRSFYIPQEMLQELLYHAARLDRSVSWIVQRCIKIALPEIRKLPSVNELPDELVPPADTTAGGVRAPSHADEQAARDEAQARAAEGQP